MKNKKQWAAARSEMVAFAERPDVQTLTLAIRRTRPGSRAVAPWRVIRSGHRVHAVCLVCERYLGESPYTPLGVAGIGREIVEHIQASHSIPSVILRCKVKRS
jgi:hypothetical protein